MNAYPDDFVHNLDGSKSTRYGGMYGRKLINSAEQAKKIRADKDSVQPVCFIVSHETYLQLMHECQVELFNPKFGAFTLEGIPVYIQHDQNTPTAIQSFTGQYRFLSNFFECHIKDNGWVFPSAEHLYQAYKAKTAHHASFVWNAGTPAAAKRVGRSITVREDWEEIKLSVMHHVVFQKFTQNVHLAELLLETGSAQLIEGNTWGDRFWGTVNCQGENHLGRILMSVRQDLKRIRNA